MVGAAGRRPSRGRPRVLAGLRSWGGVHGKERLPGLGDLACWYNAEHRELQVLKGATILTVQIKRNGDATGALTTVAKKALARLP